MDDALESKAKLRQKRSAAFRNSLSHLRLRVSVLNGLLFCVATLWRGQPTEAWVAGFYFVIAALFLAITFLRILAEKWLLIPLIFLDLAVSAYLIYGSGGVSSDLYPVLFLPVMAAAIFCRYPGIMLWSTLMAAVLTAGSLWAPNFHPLELFVKSAYLYLAGFFCGYLVQNTYTATEEVSRTLARWNTDLERLNNFSLEVTASSTLEEIVGQTLKIVRRNISDSMVAMMVFDEQGVLRIFDVLDWEVEWKERYRQNPLSRNSLSLAPILVFQKPLLCSNIRKHEELIKVFQGIPVESFFAFPLVIEREVAGVLVLTCAEPRQLTDQEVGILTKIVNQAGLAIQNIVRLRGEEEKADKDGLTGLYNRGYFNEKLDEVIYQGQQQLKSISLILLDIDNFKEYNDTYGHPAGDQMLKKVAATITAAVGAKGIAARYGGEEFAIILPDTAIDAALEMAEKIRSRIAAMVDLTLKTRVTISLGAANLPQHAKDRTGLLEYTDKSLYQAKRTGKNRVCCGY